MMMVNGVIQIFGRKVKMKGESYRDKGYKKGQTDIYTNGHWKGQWRSNSTTIFRPTFILQVFSFF